jgi:hypothetical protein
MKRIAGLAGGVLLLLNVLLVGSAFAQYPPTAATAEVSDSTVTPGQTITVSGSNWEPGSTVEIRLMSQTFFLGRADVAADGTFSTSVTIPAEVSPGTHVLEVSGTDVNGNPAIATTILTVLGAISAGTGANLSGSLAILLTLLVVGVAAIVASRRRTKADQPRRVESARP